MSDNQVGNVLREAHLNEGIEGLQVIHLPETHYGCGPETIYRLTEAGSTPRRVGVIIPTCAGDVETVFVDGARIRVFGSEKEGSDLVGVVNASTPNLNIETGCASGDCGFVHHYKIPGLGDVFFSGVFDGISPANLELWRSWLIDNPQFIQKIKATYGEEVLKTLNPDILFATILSKSAPRFNDFEMNRRLFDIMRPRNGFTVMNDMQDWVILAKRKMNFPITEFLHGTYNRYTSDAISNWVGGVFRLQLAIVTPDGNVSIADVSSGADVAGFVNSSQYFASADHNGPYDVLAFEMDKTRRSLFIDRKLGAVYDGIGGFGYDDYRRDWLGHIGMYAVPFDRFFMRAATDGVFINEPVGIFTMSTEEVCRELARGSLRDDCMLIEVKKVGLDVLLGY